MIKEVILAIDQGTTNTKAVLLDRSATLLFRTSTPLNLNYPEPGFVEQDPLLLWSSVLAVIRGCINEAKRENFRIAGIAISNQRETALAWRPGATPVPVAPAISWQCRRSSTLCDLLNQHHTVIRNLTGLPLDPLASAGKWAWLLSSEQGLREKILCGEVLLGNVDAWLLSNLTGGKSHITDHSNASRTGLFSLSEMEWCDEILALYNVPKQGLPSVQPSSSYFGVCSQIPELEGVPIVAMIGDSHAALVGHGVLKTGLVKATYGTGSSLMMLSKDLLADSTALARTVAWSDASGVRFALEGNIAMTGSAVQWVGEFLGLANPIEDAVELASSVVDSAGLRFVPAMVGLGAPYWDAQARGVIANLTTTHKAANLARAALDAISFQVADVLFVMERESGASIPSLRVDGGATRNDSLMQMQADLLGIPVVRSATAELSALGAGLLGGLTLGWYSSTDNFTDLPRIESVFEPSVTHSLNASYASWKHAVTLARTIDGEARG